MYGCEGTAHCNKGEKLTMKRPKLIISDIDGTIFGREDTITEGLKRLRSLLKEYQVPFTLASGRCYEQMEALISYLDVSLPVIVNNGAGIMAGGRLDWGEEMDPEDLREAVQYADSCGMMVAFYGAETETVYRHNAYVQSYIDRFHKKYRYYLGTDETMDEEQWRRQNIQKLLVIDSRKPGRIDKVVEKIWKHTEGLSIVCYDDRSADIMPQSCSKEWGVRKAAGMLGIATEDIMAIGDNENDIGMIRSAGIGVAVGNATQALKEVADYVCEKEEAAGVAEAVERFFLSRGADVQKKGQGIL